MHGLNLFPISSRWCGSTNSFLVNRTITTIILLYLLYSISSTHMHTKIVQLPNRVSSKTVILIGRRIKISQSHISRGQETERTSDRERDRVAGSVSHCGRRFIFTSHHSHMMKRRKKKHRTYRLSHPRFSLTASFFNSNKVNQFQQGEPFLD
jgi:hypothetical protein